MEARNLCKLNVFQCIPICMKMLDSVLCHSAVMNATIIVE